jgi:cell division protein FtsQ
MRLLPDQIRVTVVERHPVAFARQGQQFGLVDANGILLAMSPSAMARNHYSFPTLSGIDARDPQTSRKARMELYLRLLAELDSSGQKLSEQISEIDLTDPEDARVTMQDDDTLLHFGEDHFLDRYQRYKAHIAEWRQQYPKLAAVDLRYDQQVVLEMAKGTSAVEAAVSGEPASNADAGKPSAAGSLVKAQAELDAGASGNVKPSPSEAGKPALKASHGDAAVKPAAGSSAKPKTVAKKDKALKDKKRAEAQRTALNRNKRKTAAPSRPAATGIEGE